jgi:hypothetical protein
MTTRRIMLALAAALPLLASGAARAQDAVSLIKRKISRRAITPPGA